MASTATLRHELTGDPDERSEKGGFGNPALALPRHLLPMGERRPRLDFGLYANNRASVFLPDFSMERLLDLAVEAEELGYHSMWVGDSMLAKPRYDPIVTLTAIAARVPRPSRSPPGSCSRTSGIRW